MRAFVVLSIATLLSAPFSLGHTPAGPITSCQDSEGEGYHDYVPPNPGFLVIGGDGNLEDCGPNTFSIGSILNDNGDLCQRLKQDPALQLLWERLCLASDTGVDQAAFDYDGELDYGHGGVFLAVNTGDFATFGSFACYGMVGHHDNNIGAQEWPDGSGPAFTVTADVSRTPPAPGPKGPRTDCGDSIVEPCDSTPPAPSNQVFPVNVVIDTINAQLFELFGPNGDGETCNLDDCAERNPPPSPSTSPQRSHPTAHTSLLTTCAPGIDGVYVVFIEPDLDAPDAPQFGHVWTGGSGTMPPTTDCSDGLDNDNDGRTDFPGDPGCESGLDDSEGPDPVCGNRVDDDGDGATDWPMDPGCTHERDESEENPTTFREPPVCATTVTTLENANPADYTVTVVCHVPATVDCVEDDLSGPGVNHVVVTCLVEDACEDKGASVFAAVTGDPGAAASAQIECGDVVVVGPADPVVPAGGAAASDFARGTKTVLDYECVMEFRWDTPATVPYHALAACFDDP